MANLAEIGTVEAAWRPLTTQERPRAEYYLGAVSRQIRRRWRDVDQRLESNELDADDVSDVVVQLVIAAVDVPAASRKAKSWSESAGIVSKSVSLAGGKDELFEFEQWMIDVFEAASTALPQYSAPPSGNYEALFIWREGRCP